MKKYKSELTMLPIFYEDTLVGFVRDIIIDPSTGKVLAFAINKDLTKVIPFDQMIYFLDRFFTKERDPIYDSKDIIRIKEIIEQQTYISKQQVKFQDGTVLGRLADFQIELNFGILTQIEARKSYFFFSKSTLVAATKIYEISSSEIIIKDSSQEKIKKAEPVLDPA